MYKPCLTLSLQSIAFCTLLLLLGMIGSAEAQRNYGLEAGTLVSSSGQTPFWQRSNQYGTIPLQNPLFYASASIRQDYDSTLRVNQKIRAWAWGYGANVHLNVGKQSNVLLPEAYLKTRWKALECYVGRRKEIMGLVDSSLSSGSYIWSGNALPMPKIQISIPNYVSVLGHGLLAIKGNFAHAWFGKQKYVEGYYLHQKSLYGRIGREHAPFQFFAGINHQVQWGGYNPYLVDNNAASVDGHFANDFNTYLNIVAPLPIVRKTFVPKTFVQYDDANYGGNQLGSLDLAAQIQWTAGQVLLYRQLPYELGSLFTSLVNADDGLYGIALRLKQAPWGIRAFTIEGFHSNNQGSYRAGIARLLGLEDSHFGERHGYFNHGQYYDGWSYQGNTIGTPLILPNADWGITATNQRFSNFNQVRSLYWAMEGHFRQWQYRLRSSFVQYKMGYTNPLQQVQWTAQVLLQKQFSRQLLFKTNLAWEQGSLWKNNLGIRVAFAKTW